MPDTLEELLAKRFIQRRDVKAVQQDGHGYHPAGAYVPDHEPKAHKDAPMIYRPWKMGDLKAHVAGTKTFGHYMVDTEGNTKLFAFDIDLVKKGFWISNQEDKLMNGGQECNPREIWLTPNHEGIPFLTSQLRALAEGIAIRTHRLVDGAFPVAIAYSGNKGLHVYGFTGTTPAKEARGIAIEVLKSFNCFEPTKGQNFWGHKTEYKNLEIEVFPKQDDLDQKEFGNLMRLPLGVNRKSGQEGFFIDTQSGQTVLKKMNPLAALNGEYSWGN